MRISQLAVAVFALGWVGVAAADPKTDSKTCAGTSGIDGIAVDKAGHGIPGVGVHVEPADHDSGYSATTGNDGTFHIVCVRPGGAYVEAGTETLGATPQTVTVTKSLHAVVHFEMVETIIAGVVIGGGAPVAGAKVSIHGPLDGADNQDQEVDTDASGHFEMRAMPPGRYHVEVHDGTRTIQTQATTNERNVKITVR